MPVRLESFVIACRTTTATRAPTKTRWSASAAGRLDEPDEQLDRKQDGRRDEDEEEREEHDLGARGATDREERRVAAEDVEQRLREREPVQHEELRAPHERRPQKTGFGRPASDARTLVSPRSEDHPGPALDWPDRAPVAQGIERAPPEREVAGSIPARRIRALSTAGFRLFKRSGVSGMPAKARPVQTPVRPRHGDSNSARCRPRTSP